MASNNLLAMPSRGRNYGMVATSFGLSLHFISNFHSKQQFVGYAFKGRNYGMVATSFGLSDTLFKF
jgi:hypothetical protein